MASQPQSGTHSEAAKLRQNGPPYPPQFQSLGQVPSVLPDIPVNAFFLVLFIISCFAHIIVFRHNMSRGKKFPISMMVAVFSITRIFATILRIAWACHPTNVSIGIAATIFVYAGIVLLFLANLIFAQRLVRAQHPRFGWSKPISIAFPVSFVVTIAAILCLVVAVLVKFFTLNPSSISATTNVQRFGTTWLAIVAFLPLPIVGASSLARIKLKKTNTIDKFGEGSMRAKIAIAMTSAFLLSLGAWYRAGTTLADPVPIMLNSTPPRPAPEAAYLSKACFYIFNFTLEIIVCLSWFAMRIDKRFHIPDKAKGPFSYAGGFVFAGEAGNEKKRISNVQGSERHSIGAASQRSSRLSISSRQSKQLEVLEKRISWGGVSQRAVQSTATRDDMNTEPHKTPIEQDPAEDFAIDGVEKELGFDPKSGRWAVRPISGMSNVNSRPSSMVSSPE